MEALKLFPYYRDKISLEDTFARSAIINGMAHKIGYIYLPEFYADFDDPNRQEGLQQMWPKK